MNGVDAAAKSAANAVRMTTASGTTGVLITRSARSSGTTRPSAATR